MFTDNYGNESITKTHLFSRQCPRHVTRWCLMQHRYTKLCFQVACEYCQYLRRYPQQVWIGKDSTRGTPSSRSSFQPDGGNVKRGIFVCNKCDYEIIRHKQTIASKKINWYGVNNKTPHRFECNCIFFFILFGVLYI